MNEYFECSVSFLETKEDGTEKKKSEVYLVSGVTFMDAEVKITESILDIVKELKIKAIKRVRVNEILPYDNETCSWFKCKLDYITFDEKSGKEKKDRVTMLVEAKDIEGANQMIQSHMRQSLSDYYIVSITKSGIVDVFA